MYLDPGDVFAREPMSAMFSDPEDGQRLVFAAVHILYGDGRADRTPEIRALADYWSWLEESFDAPVVLAGDFNLKPDDRAWRALGKNAQPLIRRGASTLSSHDKRYAHLYDNIWARPGELDITSKGIGRFPGWLGITHKHARKHVSDHAPVYFTLGDKQVKTSALSRSGSAQPYGERIADAGSGSGCIDLNAASALDLERLNHIGPSRAQAVIAHRPYEAVSDLRAVSGLGPSRVANIREGGQLCPL